MLAEVQNICLQCCHITDKRCTGLKGPSRLWGLLSSSPGFPSYVISWLTWTLTSHSFEQSRQKESFLVRNSLKDGIFIAICACPWHARRLKFCPGPGPTLAGLSGRLRVCQSISPSSSLRAILCDAGNIDQFIGCSGSTLSVSVDIRFSVILSSTPYSK